MPSEGKTHNLLWIHCCICVDCFSHFVVAKNTGLSQIKLFEPVGGRAYLQYTENVSKNNAGGLKERKIKAKQVTHHANLQRPDRCFVELFKLYVSHRPDNEIKGDAFYLTPLRNPRASVWYSCMPIGNHTLASTVQRICKSVGIGGYKTNHLLRVSAVTRLSQAVFQKI